MSASSEIGVAVERATTEINRTSTAQIARVVDRSERSVNAVIARRTTFLSRIIPDQAERARRAGELRLVETEFEFYARSLSAMREMQLNNLQELVNAARARTCGELRMGTTQYLTRKWTELRELLAAEFDKVATFVEKEMEKAEQYSTQLVKDVAVRRAEEAIIAYSEYEQRMMRRFEELTEHEIRT